MQRRVMVFGFSRLAPLTILLSILPAIASPAIVDAADPNVLQGLYHDGVKSFYGGDYTRRFGEIFGRVAQSTKSALVPFLLSNVADVPEAASLFQADRIHPLAAAHPRILDNVWPELRKLLR